MSDLPTQTIEMSWQPEKADYREVALLCRRKVRRVMFGLLVGIGLFSIVVAALGQWTFGYAWGIGLWVYALVLHLFSQRNAGAGFWKHDFLRSAKQVTLSRAGGVEMRSPESNGSYVWNAFVSAQESERLFLLRLSKAGGKPGAFLVLPKRGFATGADLETGRELLRSCVEGGVVPL